MTPTVGAGGAGGAAAPAGPGTRLAGRDDDPVTRRLLTLTTPGGPLADLVRPELFPPAFWRCWGERMLPRPIVVPEATLARAAQDTLALFDLIAQLPERLFDGDLTRYGAALGIDQRRIDLLRRFPLAGRTRYGRADFYHDGHALRLLEFNVASDLGGVDRCVAQEAMLAVPAMRALADEVGLAFEHTGRRLAADLRAAAGDDEPTVVVTCAPGGRRRFGHLLEAFAELMCGLGVDLRLAEAPELGTVRGRVALRGAPVHVILRFFTIDDVIDDGVGEADGVAPWARPLLHAAVDGSLVLWTPLDSTLLSNKGTLALLHADTTPLTATERALVRRLVPCSWILDADDGLLDFCLHQRERLILKPLRDFGGGGLLPGWETTPDRWRQELDDRLGRGHLVQERVVPRTEPVADPRTGAVTDWVATWGVFVTPSGYAGTDVRAAPAHRAGVVNYGRNPSTRTAGVFTHRLPVT